MSGGQHQSLSFCPRNHSGETQRLPAPPHPIIPTFRSNHERLVFRLARFPAGYYFTLHVNQSLVVSAYKFMRKPKPK